MYVLTMLLFESMLFLKQASITNFVAINGIFLKLRNYSNIILINLKLLLRMQIYIRHRYIR